MKIGKFNFSENKTYIIAELSANHKQQLQLAKDTIYAAKQCGADAIKLQTYTPDTITLNVHNKYFQAQGLWEGENLYDLYKRAYTPWEWHEELFDYARGIDIDIFSSPFDKTAVDFLEKFNPSAYKIASFEITDYELIRYTAQKNRPIIISTGIATIQEIQDAVNICKSVGNEQIILLRCTSSYPAPLEDANLVMIKNLSDTFGVMSGFSDHTLGITAPITAVALGARVIEKHFMLDKNNDSADSGFSLEPKEFKEMVEAIRQTEKLIGIVDYSQDEKIKNSRKYSRSLFVSQEIIKGEVLTKENIRSVRPGYGLHPKYLNNVLGKIATEDLMYGTPLKWENIK